MVLYPSATWCDKQRRVAAAPEITPYALWPVVGEAPDLKGNAVSAAKNEFCLPIDGQLEAISLIYSETCTRRNLNKAEICSM
jgi:hypothetical protein